MYRIQSNTGYDRPAELGFSTLQQTDGSGVSHFGRDVAIIFQPAVLPLEPPPSYSESFHAPPPSYQEAMGLECDIESAETPPATTHHEVETANHTPYRCWWEPCTPRCVFVVATPILGLLIGACSLYLFRTIRDSTP